MKQFKMNLVAFNIVEPISLDWYVFNVLSNENHNLVRRQT